MAQDTGSPGGATENPGGVTPPDNSGASSTSGAAGNGSAPTETPAPSGDQGDNGMGTTVPNPGDLPAAGETPGDTGILPPVPPTLFPGEITPTNPGEIPAPVPSVTPASTGSNAFTQTTPNAQGAASQNAPVTFTLPGGYGNPASQSFTLGEGRLAKPPITFSVSLSEGYDSNIFNADANPQATPTPIPGPTPRLEYRLIGFHIAPPVILPIYQPFRPPAAATPTPVKPLGVIGSPATTASIGIQVQHGTPRTIFTLDLTIGEQVYANQPGNGTDYTGSFDLAMVHRLSPRATLSLESTAAYQNTPNFALINAPTNNNNGGNFLNGDIKADLTYAWGSRFSTDTSAQVNFNLLNTDAANNLYQFTYGTSFRYSVSARVTTSVEIRQQESVYPTNSQANNSALFYLLGLDTIFSSRLSNHIDFGLQQVSLSGGGSQTVPYMETATTIALPHESTLSWTNEYGSQSTGSVNVQATSYRTGLNLAQPLSTKLVASFSIAYNYYVTKDTVTPAADYNQNQFQATVSLGYNISPRFNVNLSYTFIQLLTSQINSSYVRQQIYLGGSYTFK